MWRSFPHSLVYANIFECRAAHWFPKLVVAGCLSWTAITWCLKKKKKNFMKHLSEHGFMKVSYKSPSYHTYVSGFNKIWESVKFMSLFFLFVLHLHMSLHSGISLNFGNKNCPWNLRHCSHNFQDSNLMSAV